MSNFIPFFWQYFLKGLEIIFSVFLYRVLGTLVKLSLEELEKAVARNPQHFWFSRAKFPLMIQKKHEKFFFVFESEF